MPEYQTPGVYIEELPSGTRPIIGAATNTAGFVGGSEIGPLTPQLIGSWLEFRQLFGDFTPGRSYLAYAVDGFFQNGGQSCYIARVCGTNALHAQATIAAVNGAKLHALALSPGEWGNRIQITMRQSDLPQEAIAGENTKDWINVEITLKHNADDSRIDQRETYANLTHEHGKPNNLLHVVNNQSNLVRLWWEPDTEAAALPPTASAAPVQLANGADGDPLQTADFEGSAGPIKVEGLDKLREGLLGSGCGLAGLAAIDEIALLTAPDEVTVGEELSLKVIEQCETLQDRFAIVAADNVTEIKDLRPPKDSSFAAFYYPWIRVYDTAANQARNIPPSGHIAGIYARVDIERGVHKAPANESIMNALDAALPVTNAMQETLYPRGVNCLRSFPMRGLLVWGARTMSSDPEWRYVPIRRLAIYLEKSIEAGTRWVVFEPNDEGLWANVRVMVENFLYNAWIGGALLGSTSEEAYFVRCDHSTMTQDDIDNGRLLMTVGFALQKPAEFIIFRVEQQTASAK